MFALRTRFVYPVEFLLGLMPDALHRIDYWIFVLRFVVKRPIYDEDAQLLVSIWKKKEKKEGKKRRKKETVDAAPTSWNQVNLYDLGFALTLHSK